MIDFIMPGVMKCGTTTSFYYIGKHPKVNPPNKSCATNAFGEIQYYGRFYDKGTKWYHNYFSEPEGRITGENSNDYFQFPQAKERIFKDYPNVKLIFIFRDPIDRFISHVLHNKNKPLTHEFYEHLEVDEIINDNGKTIGVGDPYQINFRSYIDMGKYVNHLEEWLKLFPLENMHFMTFEDMVNNPHKTFSEVFNFLNIGMYNMEPIKNYNPSKLKSCLTNEQREILKEIYQPSVQELKDKFGLKLNYWSF